MANYAQIRRSSPAGHRGFTLLELLIAISITGLILVLAYGGIRLSVSSWQKTAAVVNQEEDLHLVYGFLRRQLAQAQLPVKLSATVTNKAFNGSVHHLSFVAPLPGRHTGSTGLQRFTLAFSETEQGLQLEVNFMPEFSTMDLTNNLMSTMDDFRPRVLIEGLEAGAFSYFGAIPPARHGVWHDAWNTPAILPQLVKVELTLKNQGIDWPAMVIPIYTGNAIP